MTAEYLAIELTAKRSGEAARNAGAPSDGFVSWKFNMLARGQVEHLLLTSSLSIQFHRHGVGIALLVLPHLDLAQIKRIIAHGNFLPGKLTVCLVGVAAQPDAAGLVHRRPLLLP